MKRRIVWIFTGTLVVVCGIALILLWRNQAGSTPKLTTFHHAETGANLDYASVMIPQNTNDQDAKDKIIFRGSQADHIKTPFLMTLRYETGLRLAASAAKSKTIDLIMDGAGRAMPGRFPEYQKVGERRFQQAGHDAAEIVFVYKGPSDQQIQQRLWLIVKDDDTALYLAGQSKQADYQAVDEQYFRAVFESLRFD